MHTLTNKCVNRLLVVVVVVDNDFPLCHTTNNQRRRQRQRHQRAGLCAVRNDVKLSISPTPENRIISRVCARARASWTEVRATACLCSTCAVRERSTESETRVGGSCWPSPHPPHTTIFRHLASSFILPNAAVVVSSTTTDTTTSVVAVDVASPHPTHASRALATATTQTSLLPYASSPLLRRSARTECVMRRVPRARAKRGRRASSIRKIFAAARQRRRRTE